MNLTNLLLFAVPAALAILKLAALSLAVVWSVRGAFAPRGLLSAPIRQPAPLPLPARNTRG